MSEKKKRSRLDSFLNGALLWLVAGVCGYGLVLIRDLVPGSCLTEDQAAFLGLNEIFLVAIVILGFLCGLYYLHEALKESD